MEQEQITETVLMPDVQEKTQEWTPPRLEALREYEISIKFLHRGCIVRVGCKEIAFESVEEAMSEIHEYVANPYVVQQKWRRILD
jgi:hypothetical protein